MKFSFKRYAFFVLAALFWGILAYGQTKDYVLSPDTIKVFKPADTAVYLSTDVQPFFPGGDSGLLAFIHDKIKFPKQCLDSTSYTTTIIMEFIIEKDGRISNVNSIKRTSVCPAFEEECKRVIGLMPRWTPGYVDGKTIRVRYTLPIRFCPR